MAALHVTVGDHVSDFAHLNPACQGGSRAAKEGRCASGRDCGGKGVTGFLALFWKKIRPWAALTRLMETSILTGLP